MANALQDKTRFTVHVTPGAYEVTYTDPVRGRCLERLDDIDGLLDWTAENSAIPGDEHSIRAARDWCDEHSIAAAKSE